VPTFQPHHATLKTQAELAATHAEADALRDTAVDTDGLERMLGAITRELENRQGQADEAVYLQQQVGGGCGLIGFGADGWLWAGGNECVGQSIKLSVYTTDPPNPNTNHPQLERSIRQVVELQREVRRLRAAPGGEAWTSEAQGAMGDDFLMQVGPFQGVCVGGGGGRWGRGCEGVRVWGCGPFANSLRLSALDTPPCPPNPTHIRTPHNRSSSPPSLRLRRSRSSRSSRSAPSRATAAWPAP